MRFRRGITPRTLHNRADRPNIALIHEPLQCSDFAFPGVICRSGVLCTRGLADAVIGGRLRLLLGRGKLVQSTIGVNSQPLEVP